jgi:hypothetical protein
MKSELIMVSVIVGLVGFSAGLCAAAIADSVVKVEAVEAARDAAEQRQASLRMKLRDGTLGTNVTIVRKSPTMRRVRRSTEAAMALPPGFALIPKWR